MGINQCTHPKCQATNGCAGACSKTAPTAWAEITKEYVAVSDEPFENATPLYTAPVQEDWYGQHQWQCGYERGWDAAMEEKEKQDGGTLREVYFEDGEPISHREPQWVGLTDDEIWAEGADNVLDLAFARDIEAKLKEKNA